MTTPSNASIASPASNSLVAAWLCFAVAILEGFDIQAMGVAAPKLAPEFGFNPNQMGWLFSVSNIGLVIGATLGGWIADRIGRKPVLIAAVAAFGAFTLATSQAHSYPTLFAIRLLTGLGFGAAIPVMMVMAAETIKPERRTLMTAIMFCGMPFGGGTCALITQYLPQGFDWRTLFVIGGVLPLLLLPALYVLMPETWSHQQQSPSSLKKSLHTLFGEGRAIPTLLLWLAFLPTLLILYLMLNWLPSLVVAIGLDRAAAPQASLVFNYAAIAGSAVIGILIDRFGFRWPLTLSYGLLIIVLLMFGTAQDLHTLLFYSFAAGLLVMGTNYTLYAIAASYYPKEGRGTGSGMSVAVGRIGSVLGPVLAGILLSSGSSPTTVMRYLAPIAAVAGIAVFILGFYKQDNSAT